MLFPHTVIVEEVSGRNPNGKPTFGDTTVPNALVAIGNQKFRNAEGEEIVVRGVVYCEGGVDVRDGALTLPAGFDYPARMPILHAPKFFDGFNVARVTELWF